MADAWYGSSTDEHAHALWMDDDSGEGVFRVQDIARSLGIQPNYAVVAGNLDERIADSLAAWQREGAGIALHGLHHERWNDWDASRIEQDILQNLDRLHCLGFDTMGVASVIVPPHACNNRTIRDVIACRGAQMVTGAQIVNPDRHVFMLGRISITPTTDTTTMSRLLDEAYRRKAFVIFSTHSSMAGNFSEERTREVLQMAVQRGFRFDIVGKTFGRH